MGVSDLDPDASVRRPWNSGKMVGAKRPLNPRDLWAIRFFLDEHRRLRDRALFDLAINSKLRGCDIVKMKIGDTVTGKAPRTRATVIQQKTNRPMQFELIRAGPTETAVPATFLKVTNAKPKHRICPVAVPKRRLQTMDNHIHQSRADTIG